MNNIRTINALRRRIRETLGPLIRRPHCLLDVPNHANSGDHFIMAGEQRFLTDTGHAPVYVSASQFLDRRRIPRGAQILLQGGGNFGDVYERHHAFRERVVSAFKGHPILIFPQTVWFKEQARLLHSARLFSEHPEVTICARDSRSFQLLQEYFPKNRAVLVPDMAFYMELPVPDRSVSSARNILYLTRSDEESGSSELRALVPRSADRTDWPAYESAVWRMRYMLAFGVNRAVRTMAGLFDVFPRERFDAAAVLASRSSEAHIREAASLLNPYDLVITERLHGHILACLMGIPSILLDNSYGKNSSFHATWLSDFPDSYFAGSPEAFMEALRSLRV